MTDHPDPDKTRGIQLPPQPGTTRRFRRLPPQWRRPPLVPPIPHGGDADEKPWWQTINQNRPHPASAPQAAPETNLPPPSRRMPAPPIQRRENGSLPQRAIAIPIVAALFAVAIGAGIVLGSHHVSEGKALNIVNAQNEIARVLTDPVFGYGVKSVSAVSCNKGANPAIRKGGNFTCDAVVDGVPRRVLVVFQDDLGTYSVDRPR